MATDSHSLTSEQAQPSLQSTNIPDLDPELAARATLSLLEIRLRRLEFLLTGVSDQNGRPIVSSTSLSPDATTTSPANAASTSQPENQTELDQSTTSGLSTTESLEKKKTGTIPDRLAALETSLSKLKRLDGVAGNLIRSIDTLYKRNPEIFSSMISSSQSQVLAHEKTPVSPPTSSSSSQSLNHHETLLHKSAVVLSHIPTYHAHSSQLQTLTTLPIPPASHSTNLINAGPRVKALLAKQEQLEREARALQDRSARVLEWWVKVGVVAMGEVWEEWESRVEESERVVRRLERRAREETGV